MKDKNYFPLLLTLPVVIFLLALLIYPLLYTFTIAFYDQESESLIPFSLNVFNTLMTDERFLKNVYHTAFLTFFSTLISFILGIFLAYCLDQINFGKPIFLVILISPLAIMPVVSALTWRTMFNPLYGILNSILKYFGFEGVEWVTDTASALTWITVVDIWQWTPFCLLLIYAGLKTIPIDIKESASLDGISSFKELIYISLPILFNLLLITLIFRFMEAFKTFDSIMVITQGGPGNATETMVIRSYYTGFRWYKPEITSMIGIFILIFTILCTRWAGTKIGEQENI